MKDSQNIELSTIFSMFAFLAMFSKFRSFRKNRVLLSGGGVGGGCNVLLVFQP